MLENVAADLQVCVVTTYTPIEYKSTAPASAGAVCLPLARSIARQVAQRAYF